MSLTGPMIEEIVAICQTKEDQRTWINDISKQIEVASKRQSVSVSSSPCSSDFVSPTTASYSVCVSTSVSAPTFVSTSSRTTKVCPNPSNDCVPKPPPHAVSSIPYVHLTAFFGRLVRKKVITRKVLKKLLYEEFMNRFSTTRVPRRRVHRSEYVIYPQRTSFVFISSCSNSSSSSSSNLAPSGPKDDKRNITTCPGKSAQRAAGDRCGNIIREKGTTNFLDRSGCGTKENSSCCSDGCKCSPLNKSSGCARVFRSALLINRDSGDDDRSNYGDLSNYSDRLNYDEHSNYSDHGCNCDVKNETKLAYEDLSTIDDDTKMNYVLSKEKENFRQDIRQSDPLFFRSVFNFSTIAPKSFSSLERATPDDRDGNSFPSSSMCRRRSSPPQSLNFSGKYCRTRRTRECLSSAVEGSDSSDSESTSDFSFVNCHRETVDDIEAGNENESSHIHRASVPVTQGASTTLSLPVRESTNQVRRDCPYDYCSCKLSFRSSDSGLADITIPLTSTPISGLAHFKSSDYSNCETPCTCASPPESCTSQPKSAFSRSSDSNNCKMNDEIMCKNKTTAVRREAGATFAECFPTDAAMITGSPAAATFKSSMYAHWWLKTKIPSTALKTSVLESTSIPITATTENKE